VGRGFTVVSVAAGVLVITTDDAQAGMSVFIVAMFGVPIASLGLLLFWLYQRASARETGPSSVEPAIRLRNFMNRSVHKVSYPLPFELAIYGSVARGSSGPDSDIDVLVVRPDGADNDDRWVESLDAWRSGLAAYAGSTVSLLEVSTGDWIARDLDASLWSSIDRESIKLVDSVTAAA
jgi:predicted nucleotidyltransferase